MDISTMAAQVRALAEEERWFASLLSNASAVIWQSMEGLNWAGFYLMRNGRLHVGPFQGKTACIHIDVGRGVCGTAVATGKTQVVPNVHEFPGHIACDSASNSEIVIPMFQDGRVVGVLDIDSPKFDRFRPEDRAALEAVVRALEETMVLE